MRTFNLFSRRTLHLSIAAATLIAWACGGGSGDGVDGSSSNASDPTDPTDGDGIGPREVLVSLADNVFAPSHAEFHVAAQAFEAEVETYAEVVASGGDVDAAAVTMREAYEASMLAWQRVEVMQLGPAAGASGVSGEFLRDEVYSWPAINPCRIDQELVAGEYGEADFVQSRLVNVYGFDALEYLLFNDSPANACPPQLPINQDGQWDALGEAEIATRRAAYAAAIAGGITAVGATLEATWAEGGQWHGYLSDPESGPLGSVQVAMDEVLRAMFYIDRSLKDIKVGRPAGIKDCSADICPGDVESPYAGLSRAQAVANLEGFRRLFYAGADADSGQGFDEWLGALGEGALSDEMLMDLQGAIDALEAVDGTFVDALVADGASLDASHAAIVELTDDLKGDFPTVLMLNIPSEAAGDAD